MTEYDMDLEMVESCLQHSANTAAGPDGVPFAAWAAINDEVAYTFQRAVGPLASGEPRFRQPSTKRYWSCRLEDKKKETT